jgi:hypothetical protein
VAQPDSTAVIPERLSKEEAPENPQAKWLIAGTTVAAALLTALGLSGEALARLIRVYPGFLVLGGLLLIVGTLLGVLAIARPVSSRLPIVGLLAFLAGLSVLIIAHAFANSVQERPTVAVGVTTAESQLIAEISLKAGNLRPNQYIFLFAQGYNSQRHLLERSAGFDPNDKSPIPNDWFDKQRLYKGRIGPSPDGKVETTVTLQLTEGLYEQVAVQAKILESTDLSKEEEAEIETQVDQRTGDVLPFQCGSSSSDLGCATALVPGSVTP